MDGKRSMKSWNARYFRSCELDRRLLSTHPQSACNAVELTSPLSALAPSSPCIIITLCDLRPGQAELLV